MLGARSTLETAVGSRPKLNTTSTRTTNTAAERIAVRDRNSTRRSLAATVQLWRRSSGNRMAILLAHLRRPATRPRRDVHEPARAQGGCTSLARTLSSVVLPAQLGPSPGGGSPGCTATEISASAPTGPKLCRRRPPRSIDGGREHAQFGGFDQIPAVPQVEHVHQ